MKRFVPLAAAAWALAVGFSGTASALTVDELAHGSSAWQAAFDSLPSSTNLPGYWVGAGPEVVIGNDLPGVARSPFDNDDGIAGPSNLGDNGAFINLPYFAVGPNGLNGPTATMKFVDDQTSLTFLWGSVDSYNTISFYLENALVGAVKGGANAPGVTGFVGTNAAGFGASYVKIYGLVFDEVRFASTTTNALEWAYMNTTPVPIPAAAWLLGSGLLGLFGLARRKKIAAA